MFIHSISLIRVLRKNMSFKYKSLSIAVFVMVLGVLILPMGMDSYAGTEPKEAVSQEKQHMEAQLQFMDVLEGKLSGEDSFAQAVHKGYLLSTDDVVNIKVYNEEQLTGQYRIDAVGQILMPLIGEVDAMSKTAGELAQEIERKLRDGYLKRPSVSAEIASFRPYYLLGEVRSPGYYSYAYGLSVIKAVAVAGGYTYRANQKVILIKRDFNGMKKTIEAHADTLIYPGDIITVKERFF